MVYAISAVEADHLLQAQAKQICLEDRGSIEAVQIYERGKAAKIIQKIIDDMERVPIRYDYFTDLLIRAKESILSDNQ